MKHPDLLPNESSLPYLQRALKGKYFDTGKLGVYELDEYIRFKDGEFRTSADWFPWLLPQNRRRILNLLDGWQPLCEKHQCTLAQLVLAWTLAQTGVTHVLAGARKQQHIRETAAAADLEIPSADIERITGDLNALGSPES
jgi:aryl-alcohol dehydrogenase-like predicted oxidoreductase